VVVLVYMQIKHIPPTQPIKLTGATGWKTGMFSPFCFYELVLRPVEGRIFIYRGKLERLHTDVLRPVEGRTFTPVIQKFTKTARYNPISAFQELSLDCSHHQD